MRESEGNGVILTLAQAEDLAARTLEKIDQLEHGLPSPISYLLRIYAADRARVASDLAGLRATAGYAELGRAPFPDLHRLFADGLVRTAALYGVTP